MAIRNRHRRSYLIRDDESDFIHYRDQVTVNPDGIVIHKKNYDEGISKHPQNFVRAKNDPKPLVLHRPDVLASIGTITIPLEIGSTNVGSPFGAATHLFRTVHNNVIQFGIGEMEIEGTGLDGFEVG